MHWLPALVTGAILLLFLWIRRSGRISTSAAIGHLRASALLVDVRTPAEYAAGHLPHALNVPLGQIGELAPRLLGDRNRVLLLHCQSGMRSAAAQRKLRAMNYKQVFNVGSFARAARLVEETQ